MNDPELSDPTELEGRISILSVGTRILLKDVMDSFLRSLSDYKTHYAPTMASALRIFQEQQIHLVFAETELPDGSAFRLMRELGGPSHDGEVYFILAVEERSSELMALAEELEADAVLVKPFSLSELKAQMERYLAWKAMPREPWKLLLSEALLASREKRFTEVEGYYKEAVQSAPNNPAPLVRMAQYLIAKPDYPAAEALLKKALASRPNDVRALSTLGSLYLIEHDLDRATECLLKAQQLSPLNPDRALDLVRLYLDRCSEYCRSAIRIDPVGSNAKLLLAKLMTVQKDYVGAVRELEKAMPELREGCRVEGQTFAALARKLGGLVK